MAAEMRAPGGRPTTRPMECSLAVAEGSKKGHRGWSGSRGAPGQWRSIGAPAWRDRAHPWLDDAEHVHGTGDEHGRLSGRV
ncbi:hypothetical protein E2562_020081 [Oryza meyeriana var. granulata]|uniref:Uncharacterized protein n=1 Tax=Oryza meyeriana var. granulata TaxID=110450 RepID=A0A6G1EB23_9ORYZ|nr:hypothetical protein E2562_020081 [Oryza meyeriana var. granulata]